VKIEVFIIVSILNLYVAVAYYRLLKKKKIKPALAMWFFFTLAVSMSLITYIREGNYSFRDNALNTTDLFMVTFVSLAILFMGDNSSRFTRFDYLCLGVVLLIIIFWIITQNHWISNIGIQLIMIISYFPVVKRMLKAKENTEPFSVWIVMMITPLVSLTVSEGSLAAIYAIRASICTATLLILMLRIERKKIKG
jgi:hypothetical protein